MNIRNFISFSNVTLALLLTAIGTLVFHSMSIREEINIAERHRLHALLLGDELLHTSSDLTRMARTGVPGPEGSIQKIFWSEMNQRMQQVAMEILGPFGQLTRESDYAVDHGQWAHAYLRSRGNTIEAGTSEIQRNIIGHFVLGLPKSY